MTSMAIRTPLGPPYEYHQRLPEHLRRDGWWVGSTRGNHDQTAFQASIMHDVRPELGKSQDWEPSREEAVDSAVRDLVRVLHR
jgi:hypothetical protein